MRSGASHRSNLIARRDGLARAGQRYRKSEDASLLPLVRRLADERPTYGYRRITALVNRALAAEGAAPANHKRIYLLMKIHGCCWRSTAAAGRGVSTTAR
jgi:hypothetical protein